MKRIKVYLIATSIFFLIVSCRKDTNSTSNIASLTVVNATTDNSSITATISDTVVPFYINAAPISNRSFQEYGYPAGIVPLVLVSASDTVLPIFQGKFDLKAGGVYSIYLAGQSKAVDTMFMQDFIPVYNDSSAGVRFINLSRGSSPISINLQGNLPSQTEFANIGYKQISTFKSYPGTSAISNYNFEVRDQASGNLLTIFSWNFTLFKTNTLVISGFEDPISNNPMNVFAVSNY